MPQLDDYQEDLLKRIGQDLIKQRTSLGQSETGSGKTVIFSTIAYRFVSNQSKDILILTHKKEILNSTRNTIYDWYNLVSTKIDADTTFIQPSRIYVSMVETFERRAESFAFLENFKNVGIIIVDECHLENFKKIFKHFDISVKIIGFTATPIAANKKDPLKDHYQSIQVGPTTKELIHINELNPKRGLVPCVEWSLCKIDRKGLKLKGKEFDEDAMGKEFSKDPLIQNTLNGYLKRAYGLKTFCFNANREHSITMHEAFLAAGLNSRHLDSKKNGQYGSDKYRKDCFEWLKHEPDAILNNVGIATTGTDEPSVQCVINNSSMLSMNLFRQKRGRGGRPFEYPDGTFKTHFVHLDMGDNIIGGKFGEWDDFVDWKFIFENPKMPLPSIGTAKSCPNCGALNHVSARLCTALVDEEDFFTGEMKEVECGYLFNIIEEKEVEEVPREMILITDGIKVKDNIEFFKDKNEYYSRFMTIKQIANKARKEIIGDYLDSLQLKHLFNVTYNKLTEWHKLAGKKRFPNFKEDCKNKIIQELKTVGFTIPVEEIEILNEEVDDTKKGATV